jgi:hypothetical protein
MGTLLASVMPAHPTWVPDFQEMALAALQASPFAIAVSFLPVSFTSHSCEMIALAPLTLSMAIVAVPSA